MKVLIVTQKVDRSDPILGFFHRWLEEFAEQCEAVHVIGQVVGEHDLPPNVHVHSLGKEDGLPVWRQIWRFKRLQWRLRKQYDAVFVHMTPIWVVLGCPEMCLWRMPVYLWYEARGKRWPLRVALHSSALRKVFSASEHGMPLTTKKSVVVGHGIDLQRFQPGTAPRQPGHIVTIGRITAAKRLEMIIDAVAALPDTCRLSIIGQPITAEDEQYLQQLHTRLADHGIANRVDIGPRTQTEIIPVLQQAQVFAHASVTSLDKAVLEAMACGCPVVSSAAAVRPVLPPSCQARDTESMQTALEYVLQLPPEQYRALAEEQRSYVEEHHNLQKLVARLLAEM